MDQWSGGLGGEESTRGSENVQRWKSAKVEMEKRWCRVSGVGDREGKGAQEMQCKGAKVEK